MERELVLQQRVVYLKELLNAKIEEGMRAPSNNVVMLKIDESIKVATLIKLIQELEAKEAKDKEACA